MAPCLAVDKQHHEFGDVTPGDSLTAQFKLTNNGAMPLTITSLKTTCGCAPAQISATTVLPRDYSMLEVAFRVPLHAGTFGHAVEFWTNDLAHQFVRLTFSARAQWAVNVDPPHVNFSARRSDLPVSREVQLYSPDLSQFEVFTVETTVPWIVVTDRSGNAGRRHSFTLTLQGSPQANAFSESVRFFTSSPKRPVVIVPISGEILAEQTVVPSRVLLGPSPPGGIKATRLIINSIPDTCVNSVTIQDSNWRITEWKSPLGDEKRRILALQIHVPSDPGYHRTVMKISLRDLADPIEVPISCLVTNNDLSIEREDVLSPGKQNQEPEVRP